MTYSSDEEFAPRDEMDEVKRVLREAKARKHSIAAKLSAQSERVQADREDLLHTIKKQANEIQRLKSLLTDSDLDLRKARYEIGQYILKESKFTETENILLSENRTQLKEIQSKLEHAVKFHQEKNTHVLKETDKISKQVASLQRSFHSCGGREHSHDDKALHNSKTNKLLLESTVRDLSNLKAYILNYNGHSGSSGAYSVTQDGLAYQQVSEFVPPSSTPLDNTLLDMCRSLEEENAALTSNIEIMRKDLEHLQQEAAKNQLIPHYRLAIIRTKSYIANLTEQLKREQFTTENLREQLEATYKDLKQVVDEKRRLVKKLTKFNLQLDAQESYPEYHYNSQHTGTAGRQPQPLSHSGQHNPAMQSPSQHFVRTSHDQQQLVQQQQKQQQQEQLNEQRYRNVVSADDFVLPVPVRVSSAGGGHSVQSAVLTRRSQENERELLEKHHISESIIKNELTILDEEIEQLKSKLESAALKKSQEIIHSVLGGVATSSSVEKQ